ncbi:MAG: AEC family transporter, partial [Thermofilaceae archaeon]
VKFPPLYAILAGLLVSLMGVEFPSFIEEAVKDVSNVTPYLALFTLGAQVSHAGFKVDGKTAKLALVRFFIAPLVVWLSAPLYLIPSNLSYKVALLESCMPPAVTNVVLSSVYSTEPGKTVRTVFSLTLMSMLIVPAVMVLLS